MNQDVMLTEANQCYINPYIFVISEFPNAWSVIGDIWKQNPKTSKETNRKTHVLLQSSSGSAVDSLSDTGSGI